MKTMIAALAALMATAGASGAAPITYGFDMQFDASTYYCVGCGGSESVAQLPGGTAAGTLTFDADLAGASRLVAFDFSTTLPVQDPISSYAPNQSFAFDYDSSGPGMALSAVGDVFTIHNTTQLGPPPVTNPTTNFDIGWNASFSIDLTGALGGPTLDAILGETVSLQSVAGFDSWSYSYIPRNDRRARNGFTSAVLSDTATVPVPATLPLLVMALGGLGVAVRRRKRAA